MIVGLILSLLLVTTACSTNHNSNNSGPQLVKMESSTVQYDKFMLVNDSDAIIRGIVTSQEVQTDFMGFPSTDTYIKVTEIYKGTAEDVVEVRTTGGKTDEIELSVDSDAVPHFQIDEEVIVFLTSNKGDRPDKDDFGYYVLGQAQGKYSVSKSGIMSGGVKEYGFQMNKLQEQINQIMLENEKNPPPKIYADEGEEGL